MRGEKGLTCSFEALHVIHNDGSRTPNIKHHQHKFLCRIFFLYVLDLSAFTDFGSGG